MYYIIFLTLLFFAIREIYTRKINKQIFNVLFLLLTLMACLRYGQGQDYFAYMFLYNHADNFYFNYKEVLAGSDPGYYILEYFIGHGGLNLDFGWFIAIVSIITMSCWYKFFARDCEYSVLSLFWPSSAACGILVP